MEWIKRMLVLAVMLAVSGLASADLVNINTANAQTLARANAIVAYREQYGPFHSVDDLTQVKGIGEHILELNRDSMSVSSRGSGTGR
jgi:competence protein ComEA